MISMFLIKLDEVKKAYVFTVFCYLKASSTPNYDRSFDVFLSWVINVSVILENITKIFVKNW
jgi:hypothetical protein